MVTIEGPTWQDIQDMELPRAPALGESIETRYGTCVVTKVEAPAEAEKLHRQDRLPPPLSPRASRPPNE